jgi:phospholipid/cholesterol/gamma-HCH transport system substrate-binding protein
MKISNETKVGVLAAIAITLLILGFNFLKGKNLLQQKDTVYAVFPKVEALGPSDPIKINGLQVGLVADLEEKDENLSGVVVALHITKKINIPDNSYAMINANPLGTSTLNIVLGTSKNYIKDGDTLSTRATGGIIEDLKGTLSPTVDKVNGTLKSLDSLVEQVGVVLDPKTKENLQHVVANLATASGSLTTLLNTQNGALAASLNNMSSFTGNLKNNNDSINRIIGNVEVMTKKFAALDLEETLTKLQAAVDNLNVTLNKVNKGDGTLGLLMNDPKLYNNLNATTNSLNILLQDVRLHPKRYVNVSVFGKKDKTGPLMEPLSDTAVKVPKK